MRSIGYRHKKRALPASAESADRVRVKKLPHQMLDTLCGTLGVKHRAPKHRTPLPMSLREWAVFIAAVLCGVEAFLNIMGRVAEFLHHVPPVPF
jgi:hypothetical protein